MDEPNSILSQRYMHPWGRISINLLHRAVSQRPVQLLIYVAELSQEHGTFILGMNSNCLRAAPRDVTRAIATSQIVKRVDLTMNM